MLEIDTGEFEIVINSAYIVSMKLNREDSVIYEDGERYSLEIETTKENYRVYTTEKEYKEVIKKLRKDLR